MDKKGIRRKNGKLAFKMIIKIRHSKPYSTLFLAFLFVFLFAAVLIFYGDLKRNLDYTTTKVYSKAAYENGDGRRLSVRKNDGSSFLKDELNTIKKINYVESVDKYDLVNDINYVDSEGEDFIYEYHLKETVTDIPDTKTVKVLNYEKFVRTVSSLKEKDLSHGRLPKEKTEIVVDSDDESLIGNTHIVYFISSNNWDSQMIGIECIITGIVNTKKTGQIYISEALAKEFSISLTQLSDIKFYGIYGNNGRGLVQAQEPLKEEIAESELEDTNKATVQKPILYINKELTKTQVIMSENFYDSAYIAYAPPTIQYQVQNSALFCQGESYDRQAICMTIISGETKHSKSVIEVSEEFFNQIYGQEISNQIAVYMEDYAYTDRVLRELERAGYEAVSVFRVGTTEYDNEKVAEHTRMLVIDFVCIIIVMFVGVFLIEKIIRLREKDYRIMRLLGLTGRVLNQMNALDLFYHSIFAIIVIVIFANISMAVNMPYVAFALRYYEIRDYMIYILLVGCMMGFLYKRLCKH